LLKWRKGGQHKCCPPFYFLSSTEGNEGNEDASRLCSFFFVIFVAFCGDFLLTGCASARGRVSKTQLTPGGTEAACHLF
jgi:hypothetical protein